MHVAIITSGGAGMFCGSCMHDNTWARGLMARGIEVSLIPTYTPIRVDEDDVSKSRVFFGGINVYLASKWRWWRAVPTFAKRWLDSPRFIQWATRKAISNDASELGQLTLDMLAGESGPQREQVEELATFVGEQLRPDIVLFSNALLAGAVRQMKQFFAGPVLAVLQGDDIFLDGLPTSYRDPVMAALRERCGHFDGFVTHSRYYSEHMAHELAVPLERFHQIPLGIDLVGHDGRPRPAGDPFTVGYFARICPEKGLHLLIEAFLRLHAQRPRTRLRVGGFLGDRDQDYFRHVRSQAARLGSAFEFIGSPVTHDEKVSFLKSLDALSVPTTYREPKGLSILEAMANGVPAVQPAHGAFPEIIRDGHDGLLVAPNDVAGLTNQLDRLCCDDLLRQRLATAAQLRIRSDFSVEAMSDASISLFKKLSG